MGSCSFSCPPHQDHYQEKLQTASPPCVCEVWSPCLPLSPRTPGTPGYTVYQAWSYLRKGCLGWSLSGKGFPGRNFLGRDLQDLKLSRKGFLGWNLWGKGSLGWNLWGKGFLGWNLWEKGLVWSISGTDPPVLDTMRTPGLQTYWDSNLGNRNHTQRVWRGNLGFEQFHQN